MRLVNQVGDAEGDGPLDDNVEDGAEGVGQISEACGRDFGCDDVRQGSPTKRESEGEEGYGDNDSSTDAVRGVLDSAKAAHGHETGCLDQSTGDQKGTVQKISL